MEMEWESVLLESTRKYIDLKCTVNERVNGRETHNAKVKIVKGIP